MMKTSKNVYVENILSKEECDLLNTLFLNHIQRGWKVRDDIGSCMNDPFRYFRLNENQIVQRLTEFIKNNFPEKIKYSHSFLRLYKNNSSLNPHTDREGLEITLSINIGGLENWPIHISNVYSEKSILDGEELHPRFREDFSSFLTPKGCGVVCYAGSFPHWRDRLICDPEEYVLQIFYHWSILK